MSCAQPDQSCFFLTAFEPSGDTLGAVVIKQLRKLQPHASIVAMGGPLMQQAGAQMIAMTTDHAAMLTDAIGQIAQHRKNLQAAKAYLASYPINVFVPIDSPAANWGLCKAVRALQPEAKIVHLVAPQLWAWAPWRISKLRRLTDHVLCLLPFEPAWFAQRNVKATFVGHPLVPQSNPVIQIPTDQNNDSNPIHLAILPGSRPGEIRKNGPTLLAVLKQLQKQHPHLVSQVVCAHPQAQTLIAQVGFDPKITVPNAQFDSVLDRCDLALVVSGTATLHVASKGKPMLVLFNVSKLGWHLLGRWLIQTRTFSLPNLIAQSQGKQRIVPEFVPHFGQVGPLVNQLNQLIKNPQMRDQQTQQLLQLLLPFRQINFAQQATDHIAQAAKPTADLPTSSR